MPKGRDSKFFDTRIPQNLNCTPFAYSHIKKCIHNIKSQILQNPNCLRTPSIAAVVRLTKKSILLFCFLPLMNLWAKLIPAPNPWTRTLVTLAGWKFNFRVRVSLAISCWGFAGFWRLKTNTSTSLGSVLIRNWPLKNDSWTSQLYNWITKWRTDVVFIMKFMLNSVK